MNTENQLSYWRAVATLRSERDGALRDLERCFSSGSAPSKLDGDHAGRLLALTAGQRKLASGIETIGRLWMPWLGKTFDSAKNEGRNIFSAGGRRLIKLKFRDYADIRDHHDGYCTAFRFITSTGPSALDPDIEVLRIDYRDVTENPASPVRQVLDEIIEVDTGLYLGQALLERHGKLTRAAWFSLEKRNG